MPSSSLRAIALHYAPWTSQEPEASPARQSCVEVVDPTLVVQLSAVYASEGPHSGQEYVRGGTKSVSILALSGS